mmetsp:Transcript_57834/g.132857  ORF Transcript_57834/g.132857 Transcript_57834/m.132857 type:complete len:214 (+) Transcript_57834:141-782(+)
MTRKATEIGSSSYTRHNLHILISAANLRSIVLHFSLRRLRLLLRLSDLAKPCIGRASTLCQCVSTRCRVASSTCLHSLRYVTASTVRSGTLCRLCCEASTASSSSTEWSKRPSVLSSVVSRVRTTTPSLSTLCGASKSRNKAPTSSSDGASARRSHGSIRSGNSMAVREKSIGEVQLASACSCLLACSPGSAPARSPAESRSHVCATSRSSHK